MIPFDYKPVSDELVTKAWSRVDRKHGDVARRKDFQPCAICSLPVDGTRSKWIHVIDGGGSAAEPGDVISEPADLGLHPIGPDCLKRQPQLKPVAKKRSECT